MSIRKIGDVYIADTARVSGEVKLGANVSIWYGVSMRGDVAPIVVGAGTNIQDNTVIHCDKGVPIVIGKNVTIGHSAVLHGAGVGDGSLIGIGAIMLAGSKVGKGCIVAAGSLVPPGMEVPDGMVAMGSPAKVVRETNASEKKYLKTVPERYVEIARGYIEDSEGAKYRQWPPGVSGDMPAVEEPMELKPKRKRKKK